MKSASTARSPHPVPRAGAALLLVVLAIGIASMGVLTLARTVLAQRRQATHDLQRWQAFWLVDSGWQRGLLRAQLDPHYTGEDWTLAVGPHQVVVQIRLLHQDHGRELSVRTVFPPQGPFRHTWQRQALLSPRHTALNATHTIPSALTPENLVP